MSLDAKSESDWLEELTKVDPELQIFQADKDVNTSAEDGIDADDYFLIRNQSKLKTKEFSQSNLSPQITYPSQNTKVAAKSGLPTF